MSSNTPKKTTVTVGIAKALHTDLKSIADSKHITTSSLVNMALSEYVEANKNGKT